MTQPTSMHFASQAKRDLNILSGFWTFRKKSITYVIHSSSVNIYAYICFLIATAISIILSSIIYINFHTFYYHVGQGPFNDLSENFNGISSTGWLLGLAIDNIIYILLPTFFLPLISLSLARIFNKKTTFASGFRIACFSYVVVVIAFIIDFSCEILYHSTPGIVFNPGIVNDVELLFVVWFAVLYIYGLSIALGIDLKGSLILSITAYIIAIFIAAFIIILIFKFLGIIFVWIFPLT